METKEVQSESNDFCDISSMISYLTQSHILIKYSKPGRKKVLLVFFSESLQKLIFEVNKETRKFVLLSDIYYAEPGLSKELLITLYDQDIKSLYGLKIITKKRVIELSATHKIDRDYFVINTNHLIQLQKQWKSTNGLRNYFCQSLESITPLKPSITDLPAENLQLLRDLLSELIQKIELNSLISLKKVLLKDLKIIKYENRYLLDQFNQCRTQKSEKDKALEKILTTHTLIQNRLYLGSLFDRRQRAQDVLFIWRRVVEFLDAQDLWVLKKVAKGMQKLVQGYLKSKAAWNRLSFNGLKPRRVFWPMSLKVFHPLLRSRSLHFSADVNEEIRKDVNRGLPDKIEEVEDALKLVCSYNYEVGYCQGMQLVTHFLFTIYNNSEKVIETLKILMEPPYYMGEIWKIGFCRLKLAIYQLEVICQLKFPYLMEHLKSLEINLDIIVTPWIVTVFCHIMYQQKLPIETLKQIWDLFIIHGWSALISISLSVLYLNMEKVMNKGLEETLQAFCSNLSGLNMSVMKRFQVDPEFLFQLEESFNKQNPAHLKL